MAMVEIQTDERGMWCELGETLTDAISGDSITVSGNSVSITLDSWEYAIFLN